MTRLSVLPLITLLYTGAFAGQLEDPRCPLLTVTRLNAAPTIDGTVEADEWAGAATIPCFTLLRRETLIGPQPTVRLAWTDEALLVAAWVPTPPGQKAKATAVDWDGTVWADDSIEVHIDPSHGHAESYQFVVNALGTRFDAHSGDKAWNGQWAAEAINEVGQWSCELAIPWEELGLGAPRAGQIVGFNVAVNAGWLGGILTWTPLEASLHDRAHYGHLRLEPETKVTLTVLDPRNLQDVTATIAGAGEVELTSALLRGLPEGGQEAIGGESHTLRDHGTCPLPLALPTEQGFPQVGAYTVRYRATGPGGLLLSQQAVVEVGQPLALTAQAFINEQYLLLTATPQAAAFPPAETDISLSITGGNAATTHEQLAIDPATGKASLRVEGAGVPPGEVTVVAVATHRETGKSFRTEKTLVSPLRPEWLGTTEGLSDEVPAPWTPLEVEGDAVRPWGRTYRFSRSVLPTEIVAAEASLLAAPIALSGTVDGKALRWEGEPTAVVGAAPTVVALTGAARAEGLALSGRATVEYDGMLRVDLTLTPTADKATLRDLSLDIPVKPEHARYLYHFPGKWGSVANSGYLPEAGWTHGFKPFVWLGDEDRGLSWFCESDRNWYPLDSDTALDIERGERATVLHCRLIQGEQEITGPLTYTFGLEATPVKQPERTVWDLRLTHHGSYGLESRPATTEGSILYPAEGHINPEEGTMECWYRPAFGNTERGVPRADRKIATNYNIFTLKWEDDIAGGSNCGFYWNAQVQGPVAWSRKESKVLTNPGAQYDWEPGQWVHLALTWGDRVRLYVNGEVVAEAADPGFIPGPVEDGRIVIGGAAALATIDEFRILNVARPPIVAPGEYEPDGNTLLLDHFEDYGVAGATTPGTADRSLLFGPGKFGKAATWASDGMTQLGKLAALGVRTLCFHEHWSPYQSYPAVTEENRPKLRTLVDGCREKKIGLLLYMSRQFADNAPEWELYHEEVLQTPNFGAYHRKPEQRAYVVCWNSHWRDFCLDHLGKLMDEFGHDGWYLDGPEWPMACDNRHHGCGYEAPDGTVRPTWDIFATREFMKRLYVLTRQRNPRGQLNIHNSTVMVIPTLGFGTSTWGGEQIDTIKPPVKTLDILPMDAFRTEFMGRQWGVPAEFLVYDGQPYYARDVLAYTLLHGVLIRPGGDEMLGRVSALWKVDDEFGITGAEMLPYWSNGDVIQCNPEGVYATAYQRPDKGLVLFVSNLGDEPAEAKVTLKLDQLSLGAQAQAWDALTGEAVQMDGGAMGLEMGSWEYRVVRVGGR